VSDGAVRRAVIGKQGWIKRQKAKFAAQPRESSREMVAGESHYYLGKRYRIRVHEDCDASGTVALRNKSYIDLYVRPDASRDDRETVMLRWYRDQLRNMIPPLLDRWQPLLGVSVTRWGIRRMKTKWGSCNPQAGRIWLNLELVKKPPQCLEFVVVHELVHLLERNHSERFVGHMDRCMPQWRFHQHELNAAPLAHTNWEY
jgi:predicted metal-dependent hydrolase